MSKKEKDSSSKPAPRDLPSDEIIHKSSNSLRKQRLYFACAMVAACGFRPQELSHFDISNTEKSAIAPDGKG
jgi:hypothetical protein